MKFWKKPSDDSAMLSPRAMAISRPLFLSPFFLFTAVWIGVGALYSMRLSELLFFPAGEVWRVVSTLLIPFLVVVLGYGFTYRFLQFAYPATRQQAAAVDLRTLEKTLRIGFRIWAAASVLEIIVSGGLPIVWLIQGSSKTYFDFGIPTIHGFLNSLLLAIGLCRFALFLKSGEKRHLLVPAFVLLWSILAVTRNMMLVSVVQWSLLFLRMRQVRFSTMLRLTGAGVLFILFFGFLGDLRSGAEAFRILAMPTKNFPDWLPSGVLWVYIYLTTPINNLIYSIRSAHVSHSLLFPNTASILFPTVIRELVYGANSGDISSGSLITEAFNVSTAYVGPYEDFGNLGMILFSLFTGLLCVVYWYRSSLRDILIYAVLSQCLLLTVFFNHFFTLPIITQIPWIYLIFRIARARTNPGSEPSNLFGS